MVVVPSFLRVMHELSGPHPPPPRHILPPPPPKRLKKIIIDLFHLEQIKTTDTVFTDSSFLETFLNELRREIVDFLYASVTPITDIAPNLCRQSSGTFVLSNMRGFRVTET